MFIFKAAVVGAGTMGGDIAHCIADSGVPVLLMDVAPEAVQTGLDRARSVWQQRVDAGKLSAEELERRAGLITGVDDLAGFGDVDFVIEAVPERIDLKRQVFAELDAATPGHAILASNTSALSITDIGGVTARADKVVGFHFFYPASTARLIEVVEGEYTSPETVRDATAFAQAIRKTAIRCGEAPGFVVNRILTSAASELWRAQEESGCEPAEIDDLVTGNKAGPIGPFRLADRLGLDTVLHVAEHLHDSYGERFHVSAAMRLNVAEGRLGRKTGRGFYGYDD
jgi:3-hydroxyacyl-CoA dehydrogenase